MGVVVRQWDVGVSPSHWEGQLAEALDGFARSERGAVVFIPFQALESEKENDVAVAKRIAAKLSSQADVTVLEENLAPGKIQEVIAGMRPPSWDAPPFGCHCGSSGRSGSGFEL